MGWTRIAALESAVKRLTGELENVRFEIQRERARRYGSSTPPPVHRVERLTEDGKEPLWAMWRRRAFNYSAELKDAQRERDELKRQLGDALREVASLKCELRDLRSWV